MVMLMDVGYRNSCLIWLWSGGSSSSWLAALRFTSDEEPPDHSPTTGDGNLTDITVGAGVLVCEAFRERSEQRANKYPVTAAIAHGVGSRGLSRSYDSGDRVEYFAGDGVNFTAVGV